MTTFVQSLCSSHFLCLDHERYQSIFNVKQELFKSKDVPVESCFFICNGKLVGDDEPVLPNNVYHTYLRLPGGKGGFGSMLRAIGAQIEKTTNHEACRDLSGRRMRDVNNEKDLKDWLAKQAEREKEKEQRRQERIARRRATPNHKFDDPTYDQQRYLLAENQEDALMKGLQKSGMKPGTSATVTSEEAASGKRKCEADSSSTGKKKKTDVEWIVAESLIYGTPSANKVDPDKTARTGAVSSRSILFANTSNQVTMREWVKRLGIDIDNLSDLDSDESGDDSTDAGTSAAPGEVSNSSDSQSSEDRIPTDTNTVTSNADTSSEVSTTEAMVSNKESQDHSVSSTAQGEDIKLSQSDTPKQDSDTPGSNGVDSTGNATNDAEEKQEEMVFDLDKITSAREMEKFGLDKLKSELMSRGLKCGGTLEQRAERLYSVKGLTNEQIDPALFAKSNGKNVKNKKK